MATAIVQKALNTCSDHEQQETDMYCKTCGKPVCVQCVRNDHKEHDWDSLKNVAKSLRVQTKQRKLEIESISKSVILGVTEILDFVSSRSQKAFTSNCSDLESTRKRLLKYVNEEIDKMKGKCEKNHEIKTHAVTSIREELKMKQSRMDFLIQEMDTGATDFTDFDLIEMHNELHNLLLELQSLYELPSHIHHELVYTEGSPDMSNIIPFLGSLKAKIFTEAEISIENEFQCMHSVGKLYPVNATEAWLGDVDSKLMKLIDREGNAKKSLDINCRCSDFAVDGNGTLYFTDLDANCVKKFYDKEDITTLASTDPLIPFAICLTQSDDLIVCLAKENDSTDKTKSIQYFARRMTKNGVVINDHDIEFDSIESYYILPWRVMEIPNGNICMSIFYMKEDSDDPEFSMIYCIDFSGKILFRYGGRDANLDMKSICFNTKGNVLISDSGNSRIRILDSNGKHLSDLLTMDALKRPPGPIALLDNTLWIVSVDDDDDDTCMIQVWKYCDP